MARFRTDGLDDIIEQMAAMGETTGELADEMLYAGAEEVREAWKESAEKHKHKDTGAMIESIDYSKAPKKINDIKSVDIYPRGKDKKGVKNVEKAFILHYGSSRIKGSHWVDEADDLAGPKVDKRLGEIFDNWIQRHGGE